MHDTFEHDDVYCLETHVLREIVGRVTCTVEVCFLTSMAGYRQNLEVEYVFDAPVLYIMC